MHYLKKAGAFATQMALATFAIGTLILLLYVLLGAPTQLILIGMGYVLAAFVLNLIVGLHLLWYAIKHREYRTYFAVKLLLMLANVPVVWFYISIVISY